MTPLALLTLYCMLILLASLAGGLIPFFVRLTHKRMEIAVSFVAGVMLGIGVLHMIPHAFLARIEADTPKGPRWLDHEAAHALMDPIVFWVVIGFLAMFFIQRFFAFHQHETPPAELTGNEWAHRHAQAGPSDPHRHKLTWTGAAVGLSLHSLIEGVALAASVEVLRHDAVVGALAGLGTFLVIFLHKPFDALTIAALMSYGGRSVASRHLVNIAFALLIPVGAALFYAGLMGREDSAIMVSIALGFCAGTFLCISMSDLLPELHFHRHDRGKLSAALILGLALAWGIATMEARLHAHQHDHGAHEHHHHDDCDDDHDHDHHHH
jgi:zinc and cadmium transporter